LFVGILKVNEENSRSRIRTHLSEAWIGGSGSTPKCHGSATLEERGRVHQADQVHHTTRDSLTLGMSKVLAKWSAFAWLLAATATILCSSGEQSDVTRLAKSWQMRPVLAIPHRVAIVLPLNLHLNFSLLSSEELYYSYAVFRIQIIGLSWIRILEQRSVVVPDLYVFGPLGSETVINCMDLDPDAFINKQKSKKKTLILPFFLLFLTF
jgi:hypothetical protein